MDDTLRKRLIAETEQALAADDWNAVERVWQPWIQQGDADAEYQIAYHYLWCTPADDEATYDRMNELLRDAAAKEHPDAIWFLANHEMDGASLAYEQALLRAGRLGSMHAQRALGVLHATGDWSGPQDLAEAVRWYRMAAEQGEAESQYDLGAMLLFGEGGPKNIEEGLTWLERAGQAGEYKAFKLLVECYEDGCCEVPVDPAKAALWRSRYEEYRRLNPPRPILSRSYTTDGPIDESSLLHLGEIDGVVGFDFAERKKGFSVHYDTETITPGQLDEEIRAKLAASPAPE